MVVLFLLFFLFGIIISVLGYKLYLYQKNQEYKTKIKLMEDIDIMNISKYSTINPYNNELLKKIGLTVTKKNACLSPCNPSFAINENGELIVVVRFVNYIFCKLTKNNLLKTTNIIATINIQNELWKKTDEKELICNEEEYCINGIEDLRLFNYNNILYYTATVPYYNKRTVIEFGCIQY